MPLPIIAGTVRVSYGGVVSGGARWSNTWHLRHTDLSDPTDAQIDAAEAELRSFYVGSVMPQCAVDTTFDSTDATPLNGTSGAIHHGFVVHGSALTTSLPAEVAEVLTLRTGGRGRRARGRIFLPAFAISGTDGSGHLGAATVTDVLADTVTMMAALVAVGWHLVVASYGRSVKVNHIPHPKVYDVTTWEPFATDVTAITMDNRFDVIRSRKQ